MTPLEKILSRSNARVPNPRLNFEIPEQMKADLVAFAKEHRTTVAKVVRTMIALHLISSQTAPRPADRFAAAPFRFPHDGHTGEEIIDSAT